MTTIETKLRALAARAGLTWEQAATMTVRELALRMDPCEHCGHACPADRTCEKCGSDPMVPGDDLCADCDATLEARHPSIAATDKLGRPPACGHSACSQHYIDTGSLRCVQK